MTAGTDESGERVDIDTPPAAGELEAADVAGLFAASLDAGGLDPVPIVAIAGVDVASGTGGGTPTGLVVLAGLEVTWGRDDVLSQPDPATARLELFDATRTWATDRPLNGLLVTIRWSGAAPPAAGNGSTVFYRGRISDVQVIPRTLAGVRGSLIRLTLASILTDLANQIPTDAWPEETLGARGGRVAAAAAATLPGGLTTRSFWWTPNVAPVAVTEQSSLYDHLLSLYDSSGADRFTYWPPDERAVHLPRRDYFSSRGLAGLWWNLPGDGTDRAGKGVYARSYAVTPSGAVYGGLPLVIDSYALEYDPNDGLRRPPSARITRAEVNHPDAGNGYAKRTVTAAIPGVDESVSGVRTARLDSIVAWNSYADVAASDLAAFVQKEASKWQLAPLRWSVKKSGGFDTATQLALLLYGGESSSIFFLQRSWLPGYGIRPIFGVMGMTITYRDGGWVLDMTLAPITTTLKQHAITWEEIDDGTTGREVQWWDDDHTHGMHESLTLDDLGYVATGLGVSTVPADTGWDALQ
jgi:hypothetical protein